jgi:hypothetical protein
VILQTFSKEKDSLMKEILPLYTNLSPYDAYKTLTASIEFVSELSPEAYFLLISSNEDVFGEVCEKLPE